MSPRILKRKIKFTIILFPLVTIFIPIHGERIITSSDIARWYLDADLVVISTLIEQETTQVRSIDTASTGGYSIKCNILKDKYVVVIDSILKGCSSRDTIDIVTPEYSINFHKYKINKNSGIEVSATGDTTLLTSVEVIPLSDDSGSYYRIGTEFKNIIFLTYDGNAYETIYVMDGVKDEDLKFLRDVDINGEKYFDKFISD